MPRKHTNTGFCLGCQDIIQRYPGLHEQLLTWFKDMQKRFPDLHCSCAGRGQVEQEAAFQRGATKAHWTQSAHNWNCAIDLFQLKDGKAVWDKDWFNKVVGANLTSNLVWYGKPNSAFYELPHVELLNWRFLKDNGSIKLVE